jgi:hypothetical protein
VGAARTGSTGALEQKGDLLVFDGSEMQRLPVGADRLGLVTDSAQALGLRYASVGEMFDRVTTALTSGGTAAEVTIYSVVVPANSLRANGVLRVRVLGTFLSNLPAFAQAWYTVRVKFGGTTIYEDISPALIASATKHAFDYDLVLVNRNNTAVQTGGGMLQLSDVTGGAPVATIGVGNFGIGGTSTPTNFAAGAVDTTAARTFEVTVEHNDADAGVVTVRELAYAILSPSV